MTAVRDLAQTPFFGSNVVNSDGTQNPTGSGARIVYDGSVPLISVNDGTRARVQIGNLASYTDPSGYLSPSHYGIRVLDANGILLSDGLGVMRAAPLVVSITAININFNVTSATAQTINSATLTLTRPTDFITYVDWTADRTDANGGNITCSLGITLDSLLPASSAYGDLAGDVANITTAAGVQTAGSIIHLWKAVPAGTHTIAFIGSLNITPGTYNVTGNPILYSLGGSIGG